ncbi:hypothetical protein F4779DRAFT_575768 [Xylariaceae sp. FL0662B]|nr:hypothetical protein F4779DRAFT_575768 [Xylariaceae sp. FL0662B]
MEKSLPASATFHVAVCEVTETGTVLMLLACHQHLLDLFDYICASLDARISRSSSNKKSGHAADFTPNAPKDFSYPSSSNAEAVMIGELIVHLLRRLDQGQCKLAAVLKSSNSPSSSQELSMLQSLRQLHDAQDGALSDTFPNLDQSGLYNRSPFDHNGATRPERSYHSKMAGYSWHSITVAAIDDTA